MLIRNPASASNSGAPTKLGLVSVAAHRIVDVSAKFGRWCVNAYRRIRHDGLALVAQCAKFVFANFTHIVVTLPWAVVVVFISAIVIQGLTENVTVIEPLSVPKDLAERGYTPEVAGKRLRDAVIEYAGSASTAMTGPEIALHGESPNIVVPSVGISLDAVVSSIRTLLRITRSRSITGEFTSVGTQLWLRLRLDGLDIFKSEPGDVDKLDELLAAAAPAVLTKIKPYIAAVAVANADPVAALKLTQSIIDNGSETDENVVWSYNLQGSIYIDGGDYTSAKEAVQKALLIDDSLAVAHANLGTYLRTRATCKKRLPNTKKPSP